MENNKTLRDKIKEWFLPKGISNWSLVKAASLITLLTLHQLGSEIYHNLKKENKEIYYYKDLEESEKTLYQPDTTIFREGLYLGDMHLK